MPLKSILCKSNGGNIKLKGIYDYDTRAERLKTKIKFRGGILADDCNSYRYKGGAVGTTDVGVGIVKLPLPRIFFQKVLTLLIISPSIKLFLTVVI